MADDSWSDASGSDNEEDAPDAVREILIEKIEVRPMTEKCGVFCAMSKTGKHSFEKLIKDINITYRSKTPTSSM
tara:strand:- start:1185 stop:1406 length:222 start_codon:yes stop_codon:yes gene_type:complete